MTLTRLPVTPRIHPSEAERIISENILPHCEVVPLTREDYLHAITVMREAGFSGPKIYAALILTSAEKCAAEQIYSFNLKDFLSLVTPEQRRRLSDSIPPIQSGSIPTMGNDDCGGPGTVASTVPPAPARRGRTRCHERD